MFQLLMELKKSIIFSVRINNFSYLQKTEISKFSLKKYFNSVFLKPFECSFLPLLQFFMRIFIRFKRIISKFIQ